MTVTGSFARAARGMRNLLAPGGVVRWHWFLVLVVSLCTVIALLLGGIAPLFSRVMATAGVRSALTSTPTSSELALRAELDTPTSSSFSLADRAITPYTTERLGAYLQSTTPRVEFETGNLVVDPRLAADTSIALNATDLTSAGSHLTLLQGRLPEQPRTSSDGLEIMLTPESAAPLGLKLDSTLNLPLPVILANSANNFAEQDGTRNLTLKVVGLFHVHTDDVFWHGANYLPSYDFTERHLFLAGLTSGPAFQAALNFLLASNDANLTSLLNTSLSLRWFYRLDVARLTSDQLDDLITQLQNTQSYLTYFADGYQTQAFLPLKFTSLLLTGDAVGFGREPGLLEQYRVHLSFLRIPVIALTFLLAALLLFFVWALVELLLDRQAGAFAKYRSRGASRKQIFNLSLPQIGWISLLSLPVALFCVPEATTLLVQLFLPARLQNALNVIWRDPREATLSSSGLLVAGLALAMLLVQLFSLWRAARLDVLSLMQARAKTQARPFWQRYYLDLLAAALALAGFGLSLYLMNTGGLLDEQSQVLLLTPLSLLAPLFLLLAAGLFLLRGFAWLLYLFSRLAARGRGLIMVLALTFTARAPRQALRLVMLLALAITLVFTALSFSATLQQRAHDVADYTAGADFSGMLPFDAPQLSLRDAAALYRRVPGVSAASAGFAGEESMNDGQFLALNAVDTTTFAQSALWQEPEPGMSLSTLLALLRGQRASVSAGGVIPAIVDDTAWTALGLHSGSMFVIHFQGGTATDVFARAITHVRQLPGWHRSLAGSVLVDYQRLSALVTTLHPNFVWLRASSAPNALQSIRFALERPALHLDALSDRQVLFASLVNDPLVINLSGLLTIAAVATLFLALSGALLFSWLNVRGRLVQFVILRAFGVNTRHLAGLLFWEQSLVYLIALVLGGLLGLLLTVTGVPNLVFISVPIGPASLNPASVGGSAFYALRSELPVYTVLPPLLAFVLPTLALICGLALLLMVRQALRLYAGSALRVEDEGQAETVTPGELRRWKREAHRRAQRKLRERRTSVSAFLALLRWRFRRSWGLLVLEGAGLVFATMLLCLVPLLMNASSSIGLSNLLHTSPAGTTLTLTATTGGLSSRVAQNLQSQFDALLRKHVGTYLDADENSTIKLSGMNLAGSLAVPQHYYSSLVGADPALLKSNLALTQGRLPVAQMTQGEVETLLSTSVASQLRVGVGNGFQLQFQNFSYQPAQHAGKYLLETLDGGRVSPAGLPSGESENQQLAAHQTVGATAQ